MRLRAPNSFWSGPSTCSIERISSSGDEYNYINYNRHCSEQVMRVNWILCNKINHFVEIEFSEKKMMLFFIQRKYKTKCKTMHCVNHKQFHDKIIHQQLYAYDSNKNQSVYQISLFPARTHIHTHTQRYSMEL